MTLLIDNRTECEISEELTKVLEKVCLESLQYEEFEEDCEIITKNSALFSCYQ